MKSTKDNWIKALESLRTSPTGAISMCLSDDGKTKEMIGANKVEDLRLHLVKYFRKEFDISNKRVEKDAIEKTNKRWLKKLGIKDGHSYKVWRDGDSIYFADEDNFKIKYKKNKFTKYVSDLLEDTDNGK